MEQTTQNVDKQQPKSLQENCCLVTEDMAEPNGIWWEIDPGTVVGEVWSLDGSIIMSFDLGHDYNTIDDKL